MSGNIVTVRTAIGEIMQGRENKARAFIWNQTVYQVGSVLGPLVGGYLAQPCHRYPGVCNANSLLDAYPFALPNLLLSTMAALSLVAGFFYIEESLKAHEIVGDDDDGTTALLAGQGPSRSPTFREAMSPQVIHVVVSYALMALQTICFDQIFPVLMVTPRAASYSPFRLNGGLGFESSLAASLISAAGIVFVGLMITVFLVPITYFFLPYLAVLPSSPSWFQITASSAILLAKVMAAVFSFNENSVLLSMAAPSRNTLGLVNGVGQTTDARARALGPAAMSAFIGIGDCVVSGALGWWFLAAVATAGAVQGLWFVDGTDEPCEEAITSGTLLRYA
ncbi:hypothetical protein ACJZ2D_009205 [Fusarium nematophilum]